MERAIPGFDGGGGFVADWAQGEKLAVLAILLISLAIGVAAPRAASADATAAATDFERIAAAVERAESSGGTDPLMWRPEPAGPQGPMQVSAAAAADVGGGDRWDPVENRALGRAYLGELYRRYGNWADAVMAYNWGPGSLDFWIREGRPGDKLLAAVETDRDRVLRDSGLGLAPEPAILAAPRNITPESIADPKLRQKFVDNSELIRRLRGGIAGAADPRKIPALVMAAIAKVAGRPGYEEFAFMGYLAKRPALSPELSRRLALILIAKLEEQNAVILILARGRHTTPAIGSAQPQLNGLKHDG